ncbi:hypothetical protein BDA96_09G015800 [Sorghum bicolor]|uniref:Uncharacterized protein n=1 Tax=Sorghum bicolor TaxID=4558 RepID=A0A921Q6P3_SORBI|nr:hypothetical protein BDA96_09G015800 [Sorghum bicolor]
MARSTSTAAAASGLLAACAVLLLFAGQSAAATFDFPFIAIFPSIFPTGSQSPPTVRIYSKQNTGLNMAVRDGKVVLVTATDGDAKQLWWKILAPTWVGYGYWLVNVATRQAMAPPAYGMQVQLVDFNPLINGKQSLWVPTAPLDGGVFYQIKAYKQYSKSLNGLGGYAYDGTVIGIYTDTPASPNTLGCLQ